VIIHLGEARNRRDRYSMAGINVQRSSLEETEQEKIMGYGMDQYYFEASKPPMKQK